MPFNLGRRGLSDKDLKNTKKVPKYKGWYLSQFFMTTCSANVEPYLPLYAQSLGATSTEIGIFSGIYYLVNIFQLIWAKLALRLKKNQMMVFLGYLFTALFFIPIAFLKSGQILFLLVLRFLQGISYSAAVPTQASLLADHIPKEERTKRISRFTQYGLVGALFGSLFGGFLFTYLADTYHLAFDFTYSILFIWTALLGILSALCIYVSVPESSRVTLSVIDADKFVYRNIHHSPHRRSLLARIWLKTRLFSNFWLFCVFAFIFYFGVYLASPFFIILEISVFKLTFFEASILTSLSTVVQFFIAIIIGKIHKKRLSNRNLIVIGTLAIFGTTIGVILPFYLSLPIFEWYVFVWIILGIGWGLFNGILAIFILDIIHPKQRASLIAAYNTLTGFSMFLGPVIGGMLIELFSGDLQVVFILRAILIIVSLIFLLLVQEPEIPGTLLLPLHYLFQRHLRISAINGPETILVRANTAKLNNAQNNPGSFETDRQIDKIE